MSSKSLVEVGVALVLKDQFSSQAGRISDSFRSMMNDMTTWNRAIQMSASNAFEFGRELLGGMAKAYEYSAEVYDQVFLASKMSGANASQQADLMQLVKDVNAITPMTAQDIASGEKYLAMAGNSVDQIKAMIGPATELASIFSMPVGEKGGVADMMTNIMQTFGIPASDTRKIVDQLATAVTSANISLRDLANSFQYSGAEFRNANISMGDAAAAIGVLGNQGIQASSAGTALANMMRYLTLSVTGQKEMGNKYLKALGIDPDSLIDARGNLLRLDKIISIIGDKLRNRRGIDKASVLFNVFGVRGSRAANALLQDYWSGAQKLTQLMDKVNSKSQGTVSNLTAERLETPMGRIKQFQSIWGNFITTLGQDLAPLFNRILALGSGILNVVNKIASTWAGKFVVKVAAVATGIFVINKAFRLAVSLVRMVGTYLTGSAASSSGLAGGAARANSQFAAMEVHLANIATLMGQITAMQMTAGTRMAVMGGYIGKTKGGRPYAANRKGRTSFLDLMLGGALLGAGGKTAGKTAGRTAGGALGKGAMFGALGRGLSRFFAAIPTWGWVVAFALPLLIDVIEGLTGSTDKNTQVLEEANSKDPAEESARIMAQNQKAFIEAVRAAIKYGMADSSINIQVNGDTVGTFAPGTQRDFTGLDYVMGINS